MLICEQYRMGYSCLIAIPKHLIDFCGVWLGRLDEEISWCSMNGTPNTVRFWVKKLAHPKFYFGVSRDEKCFDLMCISRKVSESLLRYGNPELLSWCHRNIWCRCLWQDVSPFLESLEFFMTYVNLCLTKICLFIVKILSQSCNFWCAQKNVKNGDLEFSNHKNIAYPLLSKVFANIWCL